MKHLLLLSIAAMVSAGLYGLVDFSGDVRNGTLIDYRLPPKEASGTSTLLLADSTRNALKQVIASSVLINELSLDDFSRKGFSERTTGDTPPTTVQKISKDTTRAMHTTPNPEDGTLPEVLITAKDTSPKMVVITPVTFDISSLPGLYSRAPIPTTTIIKPISLTAYVAHKIKLKRHKESDQ